MFEEPKGVYVGQPDTGFSFGVSPEQIFFTQEQLKAIREMIQCHEATMSHGSMSTEVRRNPNLNEALKNSQAECLALRKMLNRVEASQAKQAAFWDLELKMMAARISFWQKLYISLKFNHYFRYSFKKWKTLLMFDGHDTGRYYSRISFWESIVSDFSHIADMAHFVNDYEKVDKSFKDWIAGKS